MADDWSAWGPLAQRYSTQVPRKILALDGGGIRGLITLGALVAIERQLRERHGDPKYRLCQFFDLIGGTSTGAIIAAGLARGMSVGEVAGFDERFGSAAFKPRPLWDNAELTAVGLEELGLRDLDPRTIGRMDDVDNIGDLERVGAALGARVNLDHMGGFAA